MKQEEKPQFAEFIRNEGLEANEDYLEQTAMFDEPGFYFFPN